ncbi:hypothetical protein C9374_014606 [Naegleria lovaniensis]|uniref:Deoxynucleoside kinase domain-containing protein n=1 Tax=Naegleria lovaniensis TaxID=51637 RepID=A0AA88GVJ5_NAELO|nr:uncharacterized protein C9374_014606 [Naegleria lovaniensis]KAG2389206.1 hypothetical protein C9374_014606 [Naegleria lovaniensis]
MSSSIVNNNIASQDMDHHDHSSLMPHHKRLVCFVEGNIGSGKSSTSRELQLFNENCVSEQQRTDEWTLLSKYYEVGIHKKDIKLNYELQKQIANTYFKHYFKYNFQPLTSTSSLKSRESSFTTVNDLFEKEQLEAIMKKFNNLVKLHPNSKIMSQMSDSFDVNRYELDENVTTPPITCSDTFNIFFEGILSSSGVFTVMEYNKGMIAEEDYLDLCENYDALKRGVTGHMAFYLKPKNNIDICHERIKARKREFEGGIEKSYLKLIEEHYDSFMEIVATKIPVFVIDNSTLDAKQTAALILDIINAVKKDIKYM